MEDLYGSSWRDKSNAAQKDGNTNFTNIEIPMMPQEVSCGSAMSLPAPKSYVTMLNEHTSRKKLTPVYQLISMEGMSHEPTFVYKVQADGYEATGRGRKKQDARQLAAFNLLKRMSILPHDAFHEPAEPLSETLPQQSIPAHEISHWENILHSQSITGTLTMEDALSKLELQFPDGKIQPSVFSPESDSTLPLRSACNLAVSFAQQETDNSGDIRGEKNPGTVRGLTKQDPPPTVPVSVPSCRTENPVGSLQELTLSIRWPPPRFDLSSREGAPHDATFTMACFVWSYKSIGRGKSKKQAKRLAASNMYELLRSSPEVIELWQKRTEMYANKINSQRNQRNKQANIPRRAPPMYDIHRDLMNSTNESIGVLRRVPPDQLTSLPDPLGFLRELATEHSFDILFEDLFDLSKPAKKIDRKHDGGTVTETMLKAETGEKENPVLSTDTAGSLIILTVPRQIVCFGTGSSKSAARKAAVINALRYLHTASAPTVQHNAT